MSMETKMMGHGWAAVTDFSQVNEFANHCWNYGDKPEERTINLGTFLRIFPSLSNDTILARNCYRTLFNQTWDFAHLHRQSGVVVTGQPGTGKMYYLVYLLVRLLRKRETVIIHFRTIRYLFYSDGQKYHVFTPQRTFNMRLPLPHEGGKLIWALVETDIRDPEPFIVSDVNAFLIMAPSPDPALYHRWCRRRGAVIWGMDLWTSEELLNGLQVQQTYPAFEEGLKSLLQGCLDGSSNQSLEIGAAIRAAKILKHHTENTLATGDSVALPVTSSKSNSLAMSLNDALRVLIDNAVQLYGPIAQEVFNAVLHFNPPKNYLALLDIATLKTIVNHAQDCNFDAIEISHSTVLRVQPIPPQHQRLSLWEIAFQSDWVAKKAFQQMQDLTPSDLRSHFSVYNRTDSATSTLAGQLFEMTSHLLLCRGEFDYHYHEMQMTNIDKVGSSNSAVYSDQPSGIVPKRKEQRDVIRFNNESLQRQLVESKSGDYFLPDLTYYPFYDAFFYEQIGDETTLYILQTSSASDHRGSSQGYGSIRHITHFLRTGHHLNGKGVDAPQSKRYRMEVDVTIKYMLVYPFEEGKPCHGNPSWQMPQGWDEFNQQKDVCGSTFLLAIPMDKSSPAV